MANKYLALILPAFLFAACNQQESANTEQPVPADTQTAPVDNSAPADNTAAPAADDAPAQPVADEASAKDASTKPDTLKVDDTSTK